MKSSSAVFEYFSLILCLAFGFVSIFALPLCAIAHGDKVRQPTKSPSAALCIWLIEASGLFVVYRDVECL